VGSEDFMPEPRTTIYEFTSFVDADRARSFLQSQGIAAAMVETTSAPFLTMSDVVHLRVDEADATRALEMLMAEGRVAPRRERDPDIDPPAEGEMACRCPRCGKAFSTQYDFCPYCEPPADWLAAAIPKPPVIQEVRAGQARQAREKPASLQRDAMAEWALYSAVLGLCFPGGGSLAALLLAGFAVFHSGEMRDRSWMNVYIAVILSLAQLGLVALAFIVWMTRALTG
jgi:hypothetical protein